MSTTATSGQSSLDAPMQGGRVADRSDDPKAPVGQELYQPVAEDGGVLRDDDPDGIAHWLRHGRSTVTTVGPPGGLAMLRWPSTARTRSVRPARPLDDEPTRVTTAPPRPSSRTTIRSQAPCCAQLTDARDAWACWATLASSSATQK